MEYGTGKASANICVFCGRGGARTIADNGLPAHKHCIPVDIKSPINEHFWYCQNCVVMITTQRKQKPSNCSECGSVLLKYCGYGIRPNMKQE